MTERRRITGVGRAFAGLAFGLALHLMAEVALAQSTPQRVANPYYSAGAAAANSAATLSVPAVVYPAATANVAFVNGGTLSTPNTNFQGLPRDRVAALRAAVRVATLEGAYRANVVASDGPKTIRDNVAGTNGEHAIPASLEPSRFAPATNAVQMPSTTIAATTPANARRDTAVQPVVWLSDTPSKAASSSSETAQRPLPNSNTSQFNALQSTASHFGAPQVGNPLRREFDERRASPDARYGGAAAGNPLR